MQKLDLSGSWTLNSLSDTHKHQTEAIVPGCVHTDLLNAEVIPDPYYRDNEDQLQWIGETNWLYTRSFKVDSNFLSNGHLALCSEGLDTFAEIRINGKTLGKTDNMFRSWQWDVKELLQEGENQIEVEFTSPLPYGRKCQEENYLIHSGIGHHRIEGGNWVRKEACNYGWDWGPMLVTAGIWKPLYFVAWSDVCITDLYAEPKIGKHDAGSLLVKLTTQCDEGTSQAEVQVQLTFKGESIIEEKIPFSDDGTLERTFDINHIQRWWPAGMGEQPLYDFKVTLLHNGNATDKRTLRLGFRELELVTEFDEWGQSFKFRANGRDFFAKGANWIPADTFNNRVSYEDIRDLLESSVEANMNCMRVWGGGLYESDEFYDLCDELGICVWQDFMFACAAYPAHLPEFMDNVMEEAKDNVKRLHHHTSLFLWCGNNELEHMNGYIGDTPGAMRWDHYSMLFDVKLREVVETHHPASCYWPASEHSPIGNRTPHEVSSDARWGDAHLWDVWHGREPFEWYRGAYHRFCSEFGFQAFPHPATIESFTEESDRSITSWVMERHQRSPSGNQTIMSYMLEWFRLPVGFENTIWLSQILQSLGIKYAVEHWRRNMPRCMGATYWQLNDCWPVASWSSIDSLHRWKALHYEAKRFFAPDMISVIEDEATQTIELYINSDHLEEREAVIIVKAWNVSTGILLDQQEFSTLTPSNGSRKVAIYKPQKDAITARRFDLVFEVEFLVEGVDVAENMITWVRPKHLNLQSPTIGKTIGQDEDGLTYVELTTDQPALWTWIELENDPDVRWSDNFFHLFPDHPKRIYLRSSTDSDLEESVIVHSLWNTFQETK